MGLSLTASKLQLASACLYPFRADVRVPYRPSGPAARFGTEVHRLIAADLDGVVSTDAPTDNIAARVQAWRAWWPSVAGGLPWEAEVKLAIDTVTGTARRLSAEGERDYSDARPTEVTGTADAIAVRDGVAHVWDWKTGTSAIEPARLSAQLRFLAAALARIHGVERALVGLAFVGAQSVTADVAELEVEDLDAAPWMLADLRRRLPDAQPAPWTPRSVGADHCRWCDARLGGVCPVRRP